MHVISLWSGPRNVSTALMYSFAQRQDCDVVDEPLYAHYLSQVEVEHPGRAEVLATMNPDGHKVIAQLLKEGDKPLRFLKNMAHHWIGLDDTFLLNFSNIFLIRDPKEMLPSLIKQIPDPVLRDTALKRQWELFQMLKEQGQTVSVIDSRHLLLNPIELLNRLCDRLCIDFDEAMLSWDPGPIPEDGVWAKYWYQNVHASCGFQPYQPRNVALPKKLVPLLKECEPYYNSLYDQSIKP